MMFEGVDNSTHYDYTPNRSLCTVPDDWNCSLDFYAEVERRTRELTRWFSIALAALLPLVAIGTLLTLCILNQMKYSNRLIPNIVYFIYLTNILYLGLVALLVVYLALEYDVPAEFIPLCNFPHFLLRSVRTFQLWVMTFVAIIQIVTITYPLKFVEYRIECENAWPIICISACIAYFTNIHSLTLEKKSVSHTYKDTLRGIFCAPEYSSFPYLLFSFLLPITVCIAVSATIVYRSVKRSRMQQSIMSFVEIARQNVSRLVLVSTLSLVITTCPFHLFFVFKRFYHMDQCCHEFQDIFTIQLVVIAFYFVMYGLDSIWFIIMIPPFRRDVLSLSRNILTLRIISRQTRNNSIAGATSESHIW